MYFLQAVIKMVMISRRFIIRFECKVVAGSKLPLMWAFENTVKAYGGL